MAYNETPSSFYQILRRNNTFNEEYYIQPTTPPNQIRSILVGFANYGFPSMFTAGVLLNIASSIIILNTELQKVSVFLYFATFAIIDTVYLITKMVHWGSYRIYDINTIAGICQINYYCYFLTTFLEWWMMVGLLGERAMVSCKPTTARRMCNPFRTKCTLITVSIFSIVAHLYHTWTSAVIDLGHVKICSIIPENAEDLMLLRKVDIVFSMIMPLTTLAFLVVLILGRHLYLVLTKSKRYRQRDRNNTHASVRSRRGSANQVQSSQIYLTNFDPRAYSEKYKLTIICILIVFIFFGLCVPHDFIKTRDMFQERHPTLAEAYRFQLFNEIYTINFAYKGLFYFVVISEFRQAAMALFKSFLKGIAACICCKCKSTDMVHTYV